MAKDAKGHGSDRRGGSMPIPGHDYHTKTSDQLRYIAKDASAAATAMRGHSPASEGKYLDQVNDASTVLGFRQRGGEDFSRPTAAMASKNIAAQHDISTDHLAPQTIGRHGYNPDSVNKAIASSNRAGRRIGGKEASAIHRLLRGR